MVNSRAVCPVLYLKRVVGFGELGLGRVWIRGDGL